MQRLSEFQVSSRELFTMPARTPAHGGCLDARLGVSDKISTCKTCHSKLVDCAGHFGYVKLALPVFHIGYMRHTLQILQCICKTCSRVLLNPQERSVYLRKMRSTVRTDALYKAAVLKQLVLQCKKYKTCPHCGATNGTVKKITTAPTLKLVHEKYKNAPEELEALMEQLDTAMNHNKDIASLLSSTSGSNNTTTVVEDLLPTLVLQLFRKIPDDDCEILWMDPRIGRPEHLILQNLLVPPVPIRPSVAMDVGGGSNEDDLTVKLQEIIDVDVALELALTKGPPTRTIIETWDFLQTQVAQYVNGELPGVHVQ